MIIVFLCDGLDRLIRRNQIATYMDNECDIKVLDRDECANFEMTPGEHLDHTAHIYVCPIRLKSVRPYTLQDIAGGMAPILSADCVFGFDYYEESDSIWGGYQSVNGMRCLKNRFGDADTKTVIRGFDMRPFLAAGKKTFKLKLIEGPHGAYHSLVTE